MAANTPAMMITIISSARVNPRWFFILTVASTASLLRGFLHIPAGIADAFAAESLGADVLLFVLDDDGAFGAVLALHLIVIVVTVLALRQNAGDRIGDRRGFATCI